MYKKIAIVILILICSCKNQSIINISDLNGYWQIVKVEQNNVNLKTYNVNTTIDYFEVNKRDGFRKKVVPQFNKKYLTSQHHSFFTLKTENDSLHLYYTDTKNPYKETIIILNKTQLVISNTKGFVYTYAPYTPITLD